MHLLITLIVVMFVGAVLHEVLHYAVWVAAGRRPALDLWHLEVRPCAGPTRSTGMDRVAAAAPYLTGAVVLAVAAYAGSLVLVSFGAGLVLFASRSDLDAVRGNVEWNFGGVES